MFEFLKELRQRNAVLFAAGWLHAAGLLGACLLLMLDSRTILGINAWIKPAKFLASGALFLWTMGWLTGGIAEPRRALKLISWGVALAMVVENILISFQAARGTTSHFNENTAFDAAVFAAMGLFIVFNTIMVGWLLLLHIRCPPERPVTYLRGVRLGLAIFILGSLQGFVMVANKGHAVGVPDGGPGLPVVNWGTQAGDLRVAHFVGLHALQAVPLFAWLVTRARIRPMAESIALLAFAVMYAAVMMLVYAQASQGFPLVEAYRG